MRRLRARSVALNAAGAQNAAHLDRGIPRYIVEQLRALIELTPETIGSVLVDPKRPLTGNLNWLLDSNLLALNEPPPPGRRSASELPAIYHVMSPFELDTRIEAMWPTWARSRAVATVVTVYDLIPLVFPEHYLRHAAERLEYRARAEFIRHADGILAISKATADDVVGRLGVAPERVHVIHAGATDTFGAMYSSPEDAWRHLRTHQRRLEEGFILYVGGFEFRKNLERLIEGYALLPESVRAAHQLVIACKMLPEQMDGLIDRGETLGLQPGELVLTGYVSDADLGALYHACTLFAFPSLYEGSGLPILEAMSCGAPVVASRTSTGPEILGGLESTFDPMEPASISAAMSRVIDDPDALGLMRSRGRERVLEYSWRRVAEGSLGAYEATLAARERTALGRRRSRIALVTPWPLERSGIADYNLRLGAALAQHVDVDVVVARSTEEYPAPQEAGIRLVSARDFSASRAIRHPDRILYAMGNSHFHGYIRDLLLRHRGAIVFHDVRLTGFYGWLSGTERPADPGERLAEWIRNLYHTRMPPDATDGTSPTWERQLELGMYMTGELQRYAEQCFVHSQMSRSVLELDRIPGDPAVPVSVVPFGMPQVSAPRTRRAAITHDPLFISLGYVHEVKGMDPLIRAFALVHAEIPGARLIIAGPTDETETRRWTAHAREHAPGAPIEIPGMVTPERYAELLRQADVAVQLRLISNGEASAAVGDCLAAGVPTIVTDIGWLGEMPAEVVDRVPLGVSPFVLAQQMVALVRDEDAWQAMSERALEFADRASFTGVAEAYLEALEL